MLPLLVFGLVAACRGDGATTAPSPGPDSPEPAAELEAVDGAGPASAHGIPAFPGAEGYGALSRGGRGGRVLFVSHTGDRGQGSLRACIESRGPRTCIFRTGGTITLHRPLSIRFPHLTIAGQTAPGDGIQLRTSGSSPVFVIRTHNVIIRFVRARPGQHRRQMDAISFTGGARNVILDHVTAMFGSDEQISGKVNNRRQGSISDITIQRSIMGNVFRTHPTGGIWTSRGSRDQVRNISLHHNLFANAGQRTPLVGSALRVETINNVIYNWSGRSAVVNGDGEMDIIATYYRTGPATSDAANLLQVNNPLPGLTVYVEGLVADPAKLSAAQDDWSFVEDARGNRVSPVYRRHLPHSGGPQPAPVPVRTTSALEAYRSVLQDGDVGAWRTLACDGAWQDARDALDRRTLADVTYRTLAGGRSRHYPWDEIGYGGLPFLASGTPCPDADWDGMPDAFEVRHRLAPRLAADAKVDGDQDGYTNLEEYLHGTTP